MEVLHIHYVVKELVDEVTFVRTETRLRKPRVDSLSSLCAVLRGTGEMSLITAVTHRECVLYRTMRMKTTQVRGAHRLTVHT